MGKRLVLILAAAIGLLMVLPTVALAGLVNNYGMHYAGQSTCISCHTPNGVIPGPSGDQVHGAFASQGLHPATPSGWSAFRSAGNVTPVAGTTGNLFDAGGIYPFSLTWLTLGSYNHNSGTEYLFWNGGSNPASTTMPWDLVEGISWSPEEGWVLASDHAGGDLYDTTYGCYRCHMLGSTVPAPNATSTAIPNPAASIVSTTTATQWARDDTRTAGDFATDPTVSYPGLGIQCENCHGTGVAATAANGGHMNIGVKVNTTLDTLGQSQVCGQCHGTYTNVAPLGIYGYTPNLRLADFVDVNGVSKGQSLTKIPTEAEFMANPTAYWMFPNGSNAKGGHYYYDEWAASAHSYRAALAFSSPSPAPSDAMAFQAAGNGVYSNNLFGEDTVAAGCYKCHTGEGYLQTKGDPLIPNNFVATQDNVGHMGQECVTCHDSHPTAVGADDVIRQPDQAGERSNTGLTTSNTSICEDCHNWQMEVLGTTPAPAPMSNLGEGEPRHPQRETLHARSVMMDVPNGTEFMPNVTCVDCHMPKTNNSANRISHGMKPMLPGDAKRWNDAANTAGGSYHGQDSCTTCHSGQNRDELQTDINNWQDAAKTQAAKVAAAITVAKKSKEFSATIKTKPGYVLVGRASWNYTAYVQDSSGSVHNPPYIMAGLVKAEQMAKSVGGRFTHVGSSTLVRKGRLAHVAGQIVNGDGTVAANATVRLVRGAKVLASTVTDSHGNFAFTFKVVTTYTDYRVRWARSAVAITNLYSPYMTIRVK
jgi:Cytochrome c552